MADVIIVAIVGAAVAFTVYRYIKNRKAGGTACNCGSNSSSCGQASSCGSQKH
ncbi:MAG: FeoB-associated Cys-rich rane protein [Paenibacillaceae bacterium]|jgi:hypothetical protein|nr:FeoB-associated Cys-rich rane protein [Paenibacillaceae bacterium]